MVFGGLSWSRMSTGEKRLVAATVLLLTLCVVLLVLVCCAFSCGFRRDATPWSPAIEVCNSSVCKEMAEYVLASIDESVDPCEDFYSFTCQNWKRNNPIPEDRSTFGPEDKLSQQMQKDLKDILERTPYRTTHQNVSHKVVIAYKSCINNSQPHEVEVRMLEDLLKSTCIPSWPLRQAPEGTGLLRHDCFSELYLRMYNAPVFKLGVELHPRNATQYILSIDQPRFGIERNQLINASAPENERIVQAYKTFIGDSIKVFNSEMRTDRLVSNVDEIFNFEAELAKGTRSREERLDKNSMYNMKTIAELQRELPDLDWLRLFNAVFSTVNVTLKEDEMVLVREPGYYTSTVQLLKIVDKIIIYNYLGWRLIQHVAPSTTRVFRDIEFSFRRVTEGIKKDKPMWKKCIGLLEYMAHNAIGRLYIEHKFSAHAKEDMEHLVGQLQESFGLLLEENRWMDQASKAGAFEKLKTMIAHIGYADWMTNDTYLNHLYDMVGHVTPDAPFLDIYLSFTYNTVVKRLQKLHTFFNRTEVWITGPAVVNAFHYTKANSITFPAGILQIPYYAHGLPTSVNIGAIGSIIGHEITHAFDDTGSQYDAQGNLRSWWTNQTRTEFGDKARCFTDQYGRILDVETNMTINGINTLGENIADNGGLRQAFRAHRIAIAKTGATAAPALPGLEKYTSDQLFFIAMGTEWCTNARIEYRKEDMEYNPHSPQEYRVNIPLGNFDEFSKAFHCNEGSRMKFKEKCVLW